MVVWQTAQQDGRGSFGDFEDGIRTPWENWPTRNTSWSIFDQNPLSSTEGIFNLI